MPELAPPGVARRRAHPTIILLALVGLAALFIRSRLNLSDQALAVVVLGAILYAWSMLRVALAGTGRPFVGTPPASRTSVIVAVYNENPALLERSLRSLSEQSWPPQRVWVIDDGSTETDCLKVAERWAAECAGGPTEIVVRRFPANQGKRRALALVFQSDHDADVFFTVDSDTILDTHAIREALIPFRDPSVQGVAGLLFGFNWNHSLLTRVLELDFSSGFLVGRAAMTRFGSVLVACGSLAAFRAEVCRDHAIDLRDELFLGARVPNGDDRKLTQFALLRGKVVLQETSVGRVALPESMGHLARQRLRWSTSFLRGTVWMLRHMPPNRIAFWLSLWHGLTFVIQTVLFVALVFVAGSIDSVVVLVAGGLYVGLASYVRAARYVAFLRDDMTTAQQMSVFALSPLVTVLNLLVLAPLRYLALTRLRSSTWGTREEVEAVHLVAPTAAALAPHSRGRSLGDPVLELVPVRLDSEP